VPNLTAPALTFPARSNPGAPAGTPAGWMGELALSELLGRYASLVKAGRVFSAMATVTAPVIFSTAAGTGGPLLWNRPASGIDAHILGVSFGAQTTVGTVAGALGLTGNGGQSVAPTATTAIDAQQNMLVGGPASGLGGVYRVGTPANPGAGLFPVIAAGITAATGASIELANSWIDIGGGFIIPPGSWGALAGSATLTALVVSLGLLWAELPA